MKHHISYMMLIVCIACISSSEATDLTDALHANDTVTATTLINNGADVDAPDDNGSTPLRLAAERGYHDIINLLLTNGANLEDSLSLHGAIHAGRRTIQLLIDLGANVDEVDPSGKTALHLTPSAANNPADAARTLLARGGARVDIADHETGATPLHAAARAESIPILRLLLQNNADINALDNNDETALNYACDRYENRQVARFLCRQPNARPQDIRTAVTKYGKSYIIGVESGFSNEIGNRGERDGERLARVGEGDGNCTIQ